MPEEEIEQYISGELTIEDTPIVEGEPQEPFSCEAPVGDTTIEESTMTNPTVSDHPDTGEEPITTTEADVQGQVAEEVTPTTEKEEPKPTDNAGTDLATSASDGMVAPTTEQPKRVYDFNGKPVEFTADQVDTLVKQALTNDTQVDTLDYFKSTYNVTKEDLDLLVAAKNGDAKALKKLAGKETDFLQLADLDDEEVAGYSPDVDTTVSIQAAKFNQVLSSADTKTLDILGSLPAEEYSKEFANNPTAVAGLNDLITSGAYDQLLPEIEKQKILYPDKGFTDVLTEAYNIVIAQNNTQVKTTPQQSQPTQQPAVTQTEAVTWQQKHKQQLDNKYKREIDELKVQLQQQQQVQTENSIDKTRQALMGTPSAVSNAQAPTMQKDYATMDAKDLDEELASMGIWI